MRQNHQQGFFIVLACRRNVSGGVAEEGGPVPRALNLALEIAAVRRALAVPRRSRHARPPIGCVAQVVVGESRAASSQSAQAFSFS